MRVWLVVVLIALAGCTKSDGEDAPGPEEPLAHPDDFPPQAQEPPRRPREPDAEPEPETVLLASQSGGVTMPGRYTESIQVPVGGVTGVEWSILFPYAGPPEGAYVTGAGCPDAFLNTGFTWYVGSTFEVRGACPDLKAGNLTIDVVFDVPVHAYSMTMTGQWMPPGGNATARP